MSENVAFPSSDCLGLLFDEQELFAYDEEPSAYLLHWTGRVIHWEENDETTAVKRPIGNFSAIFVNAAGAINDGVSLFDVFDTERTTFDYYQAMFDQATEDFTDQVVKVAFRGDYALSPNVLILDRLTILPEYRGKGRGLMVLRGLMQYLGPGAGLMAMKPFPLQGESRPRSPEALAERQLLELDQYPGDMRKATSKLVRHYKRLGFIRLPKSPYMVRDGALPLPGPNELGL